MTLLIAAALSVLLLAIGGFFIYLAVNNSSGSWQTQSAVVGNSSQFLAATIWIIGSGLVLGIGALGRKPASA